MATPKSPSPFSEYYTYAKSHNYSLLLFFLTLFFIFLLLVNPTTNPTNSSINGTTTTTSVPFKRLLLHDHSSKSSTSSSMNLHPKKMPNTHSTSSPSTSKSSSRSKSEFGAEAHEVPSGPNPISNRVHEIRIFFKEDFKGLYRYSPSHLHRAHHHQFQQLQLWASATTITAITTAFN
ncbi:hypothetical protein PTKIN_Ptkin15bG0134400 [Pterospermum kingtungense]